MTTHQRLHFLFNRMMQQSCTGQEELELMDYIDKGIYENEIRALIDATWDKYDNTQQPDESRNKILQYIMQYEGKATNVVSIKKKWYWAAAAILIITSASLWWNMNRVQQETRMVAENDIKKDIVPAGNKAILTLSDGKIISLDSTANGILTAQGTININKNNGVLIYEALPSAKEDGTGYNTLSTPRGGQYQLTLPDGTKVWLNAASSITYPVFFNQKERKVQVSGEVYMEVAKKTAAPFSVTTNKATIRVLGTNFNINNYPDEDDVKVTLLEGSVRVQNEKQQQLLLPGQQAQIKKEGHIDVEKQADIEGVMAWKNGLFYFSHTDLAAVMRQLSKWYDVSVEYSNKEVRNRIFSGKIKRNLPLSELLEGLKKMGVHFKLEGRKIMVTS